MKLKLIITSMSIIGLISCPTFAATKTTNSTPATNINKHNAHVTAKTSHHHQPQHLTHEDTVENDHPEYQDDAPLEGVNHECGISHPELILYGMTQSFGRAMPTPCMNGHSLDISGGINVDFGKWYDHHTDYQGENYKRFALNDAYLNVGAVVNEWTSAFASLSFGNPTSTNFTNSGHYEYSSVYEAHDLTLEQAYITIANFNVTPIFAQFGKQFIDFSRYEIHPITRSMTQVLSETLRTSAKLGFIVPMGVNGSIYAFDDTIKKTHKNNFQYNYGASLGIDQPDDHFGWDLGVGYMHNIISAQDVAHAVTNFTGLRRFHRSVGGGALYGDVNTGPFYFGFRITSALKRFNRHDLPRNGKADLIAENIVDPDAHGAKPWAYGLQAAFGFDNVLFFPCCQKPQTIYLGYQHSHQAAAIGLPLARWLAGYSIEVFKSTSFGVEWDRDHAYAKHHGGEKWRYNNLVTIRTTVEFG